MLRKNAGSRPQITFTSDFHELVQGDLIPGPCLLRYDPLRIVNLGDAAEGHHKIRAFVRFHPVGTEWQGVMDLAPGLPLADLADITGDGLMLTATFEIPMGCDELEVWFSCTHANGEVHWDSDEGNNHWLRFGLADLTVKKARTVAVPGAAGAQDALEFELGSKSKVDAVQVRWRITNRADTPDTVSTLTCVGEDGSGKTWRSPAGGIPVPKGSVIAFEFIYDVNGRSYSDTNQGRWYIAD